MIETTADPEVIPVYAKSTIAFTPAQPSCCSSTTCDWLSAISLLNKACRCGETVGTRQDYMYAVRSHAVVANGEDHVEVSLLWV